MRIKDETFQATTFEAFADKYELVLVIKERPARDGLKRYYAKFEKSETMERGCLVGTYGNGSTKQDAVEDYKQELLGKRLAVDASSDSRREIQCPNEWAISPPAKG